MHFRDELWHYTISIVKPVQTNCLEKSSILSRTAPLGHKQCQAAMKAAWHWEHDRNQGSGLLFIRFPA